MPSQRKVNRNQGLDTRIEQGTRESRTFSADRKTYDALLERLNAPPAPNARLHRTLTTTPPWKHQSVLN